MTILGRCQTTRRKTCYALGNGVVSAAMVAAISDDLHAFGVVDVLACKIGLSVAKRSLPVLPAKDWEDIFAACLTDSINVICAARQSTRKHVSGPVAAGASLIGTGGEPAQPRGLRRLEVRSVTRERRGRGTCSTLVGLEKVTTPFRCSRVAWISGRANRSRMTMQTDDIAAAVRFVFDLSPRTHVPTLVTNPRLATSLDDGT